ncbi:MAG TPA: GNAT family N-acetyltransferase [Acidimicrobiales bacterium]|nr:GNAT family N-acetyltransferase [Acidimicrobiales bacterium]
MDPKPRTIDAAELPAMVDLSAIVFGIGPSASAEYQTEVQTVTEVDRTFVVDDGDDLVGMAGAFTFAVALPGGRTLPMAGISEVGVRPTHRRRGLLRALMGAVVDQALDRDEALAGLTASEGGIYRRFEFGVAARYQSTAVDTARSAEVVDIAAPGRMRLVDAAEAAALRPQVWDRCWRRIPGELARQPSHWTVLGLDPEHRRGGASGRFVVVHEAPDGTADGYAAYRIRSDWSPGRANHELRVLEVVALDDGVEAALLRYLLDVDLVATLFWHAGPVDLPLRWRLADPRALTIAGEGDHLWLRPLDVARCLSERRYATAGGFVVEVVDVDRPHLGGRFRLDGGIDGADCVRTDADPDLVAGAAELGSLLLGGVSWSTLRRAGVVEERTPGAAARADTLFRTERAPFCGTDF